MPPVTPWSEVEAVPIDGTAPQNPVLAVIRECPQLIWSSAGTLFHAYRRPGGWTNPLRVATGSQPAVAATPDGCLHCVFANEFAGNSEIFHTVWDGESWSLPQLVSRTSGVSYQPAISAGEKGGLHVVWADTTPGYPVIYYGHRDVTTWTSRPIPGGRGSAPTIAVANAGDIYVAWQDALAGSGAYDVYCAVCRDRTWSVAENISDSPLAHSVLPQVVSTPACGTQAIWQEEVAGRYQVALSSRQAGGWTLPEIVSSGNQDCRNPRVIVASDGFLDLAWLEGNVLQHRARPPFASMQLGPQETLPINCSILEQVGIAAGAGGTVHLVVSALDGQSPALKYGFREPHLGSHIFVPFITR